MAVRFKMDEEGHLTWDVERGEEISREDAAIIATANIGNMLYGVSGALYDIAEEFRFKKFYDENGAISVPAKSAKRPAQKVQKARRR